MLRAVRASPRMTCCSRPFSPTLHHSVASSPLVLARFKSYNTPNTSPSSSSHTAPPKKHSLASSLHIPPRKPAPTPTPSTPATDPASPAPKASSSSIWFRSDKEKKQWADSIYWGCALIMAGFLGYTAINRVTTTPEEREKKLSDYRNYTTEIHETRYRQPTRADPSNVRVDRWRVVSAEHADDILKASEKSTVVTRPGNPVVRFDTSSIAANGPIEDRENDGVVRGPEGDLCFFAVFDGHSGPQTAHLLSQTLIPTTALSLSSLFAGNQPFFDLSPEANEPKPASHLESWRRWLLDESFGASGKGSGPTPLDPRLADLSRDPEMVKKCLQSAFETLDGSIVWDPVKLLASAPKSPDAEFRERAYPILNPALAGACALLTYVDCAKDDLYVALAGDCRAVAGYWVEKEKKWRVEVLTEDQTGRNPNELARIQAAHPPSERNDVIRNGRVLGGLEPCRAFGDARYKWPLGIQEQLVENLLPVSTKRPRSPNGLYKTPPYVTARPEVTHRKISVGNGSMQGNLDGELRFLVMATDGLYDQLSNESIVAVVGHALNNPTFSGTVPKAQVLAEVMTGEAGVDGKKGKGLRKDELEGTFVFGQDTNYSTHLIRNSLAGGDESTMRKLLSVEPPISRYQRDDTTVKIVFFGPEPAPLVGKPIPWKDRLSAALWN